jgi:tRNA(Ile)-lysidine synthase
VRYWITRAGYTAPDTTRLDEITRTLLDARPDANPAVEWNGTRVLRHADHLTLGTVASRATSSPNEAIAWNWRALPRIRLSTSSGTLEIKPDPHGPIDLPALPPTLAIRHRQGGERLRPTRNGRTKTLKSLLQQSRIPLTDRDHLPLIFNDDQLIAVADRWLDHSIQATSTSQSRARLYWHRNAP